MNYTEAGQRYQCDAAFRQAVMMCQGVMHDMHLTPGEMRDAVMLASIMFESMRVHPVQINDQQLVQYFNARTLQDAPLADRSK